MRVNTDALLMFMARERESELSVAEAACYTNETTPRGATSSSEAWRHYLRRAIVKHGAIEVPDAVGDAWCELLDVMPHELAREPHYLVVSADFDIVTIGLQVILWPSRSDAEAMIETNYRAFGTERGIVVPMTAGMLARYELRAPTLGLAHQCITVAPDEKRVDALVGLDLALRGVLGDMDGARCVDAAVTADAELDLGAMLRRNLELVEHYESEGIPHPPNFALSLRRLAYLRDVAAANHAAA